VQHDELGFIHFFLDVGSGYSATPLLEARDGTYAELGRSAPDSAAAMG
jgi:hypothetical protein